MGIRRKVQRNADRKTGGINNASRGEFFLTTMGKAAPEDCPCPVCDYMNAIGTEPEEIEGVTVHRLSEHEMMAVQSLMRGDIPN